MKLNTKNIFIYLFICFVFYFISIKIIDYLFGNNIIFQNNSVIFYNTKEFNCTTFTNNYGFRDRNIKKKKDKNVKYRILVIGDSFTYGWGVNLDETWSKILERRLQNDNYSVEILNLGKPDSDPLVYSYIIEKSVPLLRPDLVIVAIEQGGDIMQLKKYKEMMFTEKFRKIIKIMRYFIPEIILNNMFYKISANDYRVLNISASQLNNTWSSIFQIFLKENSKVGNKYDKEIYELLKNGQINPYFTILASKDPGMFVKVLNINDPAVSQLIDKCKRQIKIIKEICDYNNCKLIIFSSPIGVYTSNICYKNTIRQGFVLKKEVLNTSIPDDLINEICKCYEIDYYKFTNEFRSKDKIKPLFFPIDGHFNKYGHEYIADLMLNIIKKNITNNLKN